MIVLENEQLKVTIKVKGAELSSIIDKVTGVEYMWQGDSNIWGYHAPNLFPIVGGLKENTLLVNGTSYSLNRHGFARTSTFRTLEAAPNTAVLSLDYNEDTLKIYPYKFEFQVVYQLQERTLKTSYKVINKDDKRVYFSVGAHPGFNVPLEKGESYEDYSIIFEKEENLETARLSAEGLFNGNTLPVLKGAKLDLTKDLFNADALVFKTINSKSVTLVNKALTKKVKIDFEDFKQLGIWAKPGAPFVCIEPWLGYADSEGDFKDISNKDGIEFVEHGHVFEASFNITV